MTRCFNIPLAWIAAMLLCPAAWATDMHSDAFGILPARELSDARASWAEADQRPTRVDNIYFFVGAKSLVAGQDIGHAVALLIDAAGNLVQDGSRAGFTLGRDRMIAETRRGVADILYQPPTEAGEYVAGVSSGATQSSRATFRVTADLRSVSPSVAPQDAPARIEAFTAFASQDLTDQFGNTPPSGLGAQVVVQHQDGSFSISTPVIRDGRAGANLLMRDIAAAGQTQLSLLESRSGSTEFAIQNNHLAAPTQVQIWEVPEIQAIGVEAGPVLSSEGHALTDGAPIRLDIRDASGVSYTRMGWIRDGRFRTVVPLTAANAPFEVRVETPLDIELRQVERLAPRAPLIGGLE